MARRVSLDDPDAIIQIIKEDGGVVLTDFSDTADVKKVNEDARPYINAILEERMSHGQPRETTRCTRLFGRSATARETWLQQPAFLKVVNHFLRTETIHYNGSGATSLGTDAILSAAATLDIGPGVQAQDLHRDDFIWQQTHLAQPKGYERGSDIAMGLLVPGVKTTKENGATLASFPLYTIRS
ncbi:MAG: hypothetical protein Q9166_006946 [cf. Caloplaca sp. 2 TL-2023]